MILKINVRDELQDVVDALPDLDVTIFAQNFEYLLQKKEIGVSRFAELFNIEQSSASQWKKGRQLPRPQIQYKIALFFEVTWDELMTINIQEEYIKNKVAGDYLSSKEVSPLYEDIKKKIKEIEERIRKLEDESTMDKI